MTYIPQSRIKIQEAPQGVFIDFKTKEPYVGSYIETSEGKYYKGSNPKKLTDRLVKMGKKPPQNFGTSADVKTYMKTNLTPYSELYKAKEILNAKPTPTKEDYEKGTYRRYFVKKINEEFSYKEISEKTMINRQQYDTNMYKFGNILWYLDGDVINKNHERLQILENTFPFVSTLFPILNEFQKPQKIHNIEGRKYPDGEPIPNVLPLAYKKPNFQGQRCSNCFFNKEGYCTKWDAQIRLLYWCKSWAKLPDSLSDEQKEYYDNLKFNPKDDKFNPGKKPDSPTRKNPIIPATPINPTTQSEPTMGDTSPSISTPSTPTSTPSIGGGSSGGGGGGY